MDVGSPGYGAKRLQELKVILANHPLMLPEQNLKTEEVPCV
jgi:hypothetical protein